MSAKSQQPVNAHPVEEPGTRADDHIATGSIAIDEIESITPEQFKTAFRNHAAGVALITADAGAGPVAMTATSVFSVSAVPPIFVFSVSAASSSAQTILDAETVVVHLLSSDQLDLAQLGAKSGIDRFAEQHRWEKLATGETVAKDVPMWVRGRIINRMAAGQSTLVVAHAVEVGGIDAEAHELREVSPLVYHNRTWHALDEKSHIETAGGQPARASGDVANGIAAKDAGSAPTGS